jgi:gas vesicle protein
MNRVCGFLTGLAAGAGVALLLAPRSGERTRSMIRRKATDSAGYVRQRSNDIREAAEETLRDGTRRVTKGTEAVRVAMEAGKQAFSHAIRH